MMRRPGGRCQPSTGQVPRRQRDRHTASPRRSHRSEAHLSLLTACREVDAAIRSRAPYAHTSHFRVELDGEVVFDRHYRGPRVADLFSVTKSVVATLAGIAVRDGYLGLARIAAAPQLDPPGRAFRYDNGGAHLFGAVLSRLVGMPLAGYAERRLFAPLAISDWHWPRDPDGFDYGYLTWVVDGRFFAGGWAGQQVAAVPCRPTWECRRDEPPLGP